MTNPWHISDIYLHFLLYTSRNLLEIYTKSVFGLLVLTAVSANMDSFPVVVLASLSALGYRFTLCQFV